MGIDTSHQSINFQTPQDSQAQQVKLTISQNKEAQTTTVTAKVHLNGRPMVVTVNYNSANLDPEVLKSKMEQSLLKANNLAIAFKMGQGNTQSISLKGNQITKQKNDGTNREYGKQELKDKITKWGDKQAKALEKSDLKKAQVLQNRIDNIKVFMKSTTLIPTTEPKITLEIQSAPERPPRLSQGPPSNDDHPELVIQELAENASPNNGVQDRLEDPSANNIPVQKENNNVQNGNNSVQGGGENPAENNIPVQEWNNDVQDGNNSVQDGSSSEVPKDNVSSASQGTQSVTPKRSLPSLEGKVPFNPQSQGTQGETVKTKKPLPSIPGQKPPEDSPPLAPFDSKYMQDKNDQLKKMLTEKPADFASLLKAQREQIVADYKKFDLPREELKAALNSQKAILDEFYDNNPTVKVDEHIRQNLKNLELIKESSREYKAEIDDADKYYPIHTLPPPIEESLSENAVQGGEATYNNDINSLPPPLNAHQTEQVSNVSETHSMTAAEKSTQLDKSFEDVQKMAKSLTKGFPPQIPDVSLSAEESQHLDEAKAKVTELEAYIQDKHGSDLSNLGWHGRASFQRILWQDEGFLQRIADPMVVKAIMIRAKNNEEKKIGDNNTLSGLMLYGLGTNKISYLATVTPNWANKPEGFDWQLQDMSLTDSAVETPRKPSTEYLKSLEGALHSIREALEPTISQTESTPKELHDIDHKIMNASVSDLLSAFKQLVTADDQIYNFTVSQAGASTVPSRMSGQCFEVMTSYDQLVQGNHGDHEAALGYGLVSHALDAKHLGAALFMLNYNQNGDRGQIGFGQDFSAAKNSLGNLLAGATDGSIGEGASTQIKIRLRQVLTLVLENHAKLGISPEQMNKAFAPSDTQVEEPPLTTADSGITQPAEEEASSVKPQEESNANKIDANALQQQRAKLNPVTPPVNKPVVEETTMASSLNAVFSENMGKIQDTSEKQKPGMDFDQDFEESENE